MTFLALSETPNSFAVRLGSVTDRLRPFRSLNRMGFADEDGARKAMGADHQMPVAVLAGASLENLARIALG